GSGAGPQGQRETEIDRDAGGYLRLFLVGPTLQRHFVVHGERSLDVDGMVHVLRGSGGTRAAGVGHSNSLAKTVSSMGDFYIDSAGRRTGLLHSYFRQHSVLCRSNLARGQYGRGARISFFLPGEYRRSGTDAAAQPHESQLVDAGNSDAFIFDLCHRY